MDKEKSMERDVALVTTAYTAADACAKIIDILDAHYESQITQAESQNTPAACIRLARLQKKLSLREAVRLLKDKKGLDISPSYLSKLENNKGGLRQVNDTKALVDFYEIDIEVWNKLVQKSDQWLPLEEKHNTHKEELSTIIKLLTKINDKLEALIHVNSVS